MVPLQEFVANVRKSGLVPAAELDALVEQSPEGPAASQELAKALVKAGKLTRLQATELYRGRADRLTLGNYVLLETLGAGGMGLVFKAQHRRMKRIVALKMLPSDLAKDPERVARFQREVEAAARLNHPHIVTAYDADEAGGVHFLVMEFVEGSDLARYVKRCGALSQRKAVDYTLQAARGLEYAHAQGVVHRDIKPANLILSPGGTVRVLDLGLARFEQGDAQQLASLSNDDLSSTGRVMGTLDYLSPEQAVDSKHVDRRADIYSLGCTLYFLLAGRSPAPEASLAEKLLWHQTGEIPSLRDVRPDVHPELDGLFRQMLARRPQDRIQTMAEVIARLETCLSRLSHDAEATIQLPGSEPVLTIDDFVIPELVDEPPRLPGAPVPSPQAAPRRADGRAAVAEVPLDRRAGETSLLSAPPQRTLAEPRRVERVAVHSVPSGTTGPALHARRTKTKASKDRQVQIVAAGVVLAGCFIGLLLWLARGDSKPQGDGPIVWNETVKSQIDGLLLGGFDCDAGRNLYSDIVTALDERLEGDWLIGRGLTKDAQAYQLRVAGGRFSSRKLTSAEVEEAGLKAASTHRSVDASFRIPVSDVVSLEDPQLTLEADASGRQRVRGSVFCVLSGRELADDVTLVLRNETSEGRRTVTRDFYQQLPWNKLSSQRVPVVFDLEADSFPPGSHTELFLQAFLYYPMPRYYRISNELPCELQVAPSGTPPDAG